MKKNNFNTSSLQKMTEKQDLIYQVESFLSENFMFRRNILNGKTEYRDIHTEESQSEAEEENAPLWSTLTPEAFNSIVLTAKKQGIGGDKSPRREMEECIMSESTPIYDPIREYLTTLPQWDGHNHVADLFGRIPGITSEQLGWCSTWLRSAVAHWLGMDMLHGNECVPVLIGMQGCRKSTFAYSILPEHLRAYYLDHINFGNKFDSEMALTNNLLVNIDEFDSLTESQQAKLKQTLSKVKVNGRPIFGKCQADRPRYASFLATTNENHPLCDTTGSRRYICLRIPAGQYINNDTRICHAQLYAQLLHELQEDGIPYWFTNDQVTRIQQVNTPYFKTDDIEALITQCFRIPTKSDEGELKTCREVSQELQKKFTSLTITNATKIRIGQTLRYLGCQSKHTKHGQAYRLIPLRSA